MKDIKTKINESKDCNLFSEVQNEIDKNGEYHSYDFSNGQKKFKKGFLTFNKDNEFFGIIAFNSAKEFAEMMNNEEDAYDQYDSIKVGEYLNFHEQDDTIANIIRIW